VIIAILGVMLVLGGIAGGCGDPGSTGSPATSSAAPALSAATSGSSATPLTQATTAAPSPTTASGLVEDGGSAGDAAGQVTGDEASAGSTLVTRFLDAVNAQDFTAASDLLAPDAAFQLEDVTNRVRRITLAKPTILLVPDEQGTAHLAMMGRGTANVVAVQGSDLESATYDVQIGVRRESRRDEWRIWSFDLQPL
jgi:hypothetical protein